MPYRFKVPYRFKAPDGGIYEIQHIHGRYKCSIYDDNGNSVDQFIESRLDELEDRIACFYM